MNETTTVYDDQIKLLYPQTVSALDALKALTRDTVVIGAELGAHIHEAQKRHKDDRWTWLISLASGARSDVIDFALRAYRYRERHPQLDDASQLTFALASASEDEPAPAKIKSSDIAAFTAAIMVLSAKVTKLKSRPMAEWDTSVKASVKESLRPLVELWQEL